MDLDQVQGLGPAKIKKLEAAGIRTVKQLAAVDLRKDPDVPGVGRDALRNHKADARKLLAAEGKNVPKSPYRSKGKASGKRAKAKRATAKQAPTHDALQVPELDERWRKTTVLDAPPKRGLFRRLLGRA